MQTIKALIELIEPRLQAQIRGQIGDFIKVIKSGQVKTDEEAIAHFYPKTLNQAANYSMLKSRARRVLAGFALASPPDVKRSKIQIAYDQCYNDYAIARRLIIRQKMAEGMRIAKKALRLSREYGLTDVSIMLLRELRLHSSVKGRSRQTSQYDDLIEEYLYIFRAELQAEKLFADLTIRINRAMTYDKTLVADIDQAIAQLKSFDEVRSDRFNVLLNNLQIIRCFTQYDYQGVIRAAQEVISSIDESKTPVGYLSEIYTKKAIALIAIGQTTAAKVNLKKIQKMVQRGGVNWNIILIYRLICCFHQEAYQEAYDLYKSSKKHTRQWHSILTEQWLILEAYLMFFAGSGKITAYNARSFRLGKFLNQVPIFTKDAAGHKVNIIILQILFDLQRKRYGKVIDRIDALKQYVSRHLSAIESQRARLFVKILLQLPAANFHRNGFELRISKLKPRLLKTDITVGQNFEIEIIPFDTLLDEVLNLLEDRIVYTKNRKVRAS